MFIFNRTNIFLILMVLTLPNAKSEETGESLRMVQHEDPVVVDPQLSLPALIDNSLQKYPDVYWLQALEDEAKAIAQRGLSWFAGSPSIGLFYQQATSGTLHYGDAYLQTPLWNLGQRDAERVLANKAQLSAHMQRDFIKLRVAGLIRIALWDLALMNNRYEQAHAELKVTEQLSKKVKKLYQLGELAKSDWLLVRTEALQKKSLLTKAEAEVMHARKRYMSLTQSNAVPKEYREKRHKPTNIVPLHPAIRLIDASISRKQSERNATRLEGSGQTQLTIGVNSDRGDKDPRSNNTESFNIGVNIPFGGAGHLAPKLAAVQVELNKLIAERAQIVRDLELAHHEAEHNLQIDQTEIKIAEQLRDIAEQHLKMSEVSFTAGETDLIDFLKMQSRTQQAVLNAKERSIILQRDIALYNQAIGQLP